MTSHNHAKPFVLAFAVLGCATPSACITPPLPHADVVGIAVDAVSGEPLPGVEVRWNDAVTSTDATGHYRLQVDQGVRGLTYSPREGAPVRKYVVVEEQSELRLDVLIPPTDAPRGRSLVFDRGLIYVEGRSVEREAGEEHMVSITDELGNDDQALALGYRGYEEYSPVWAPAGDAIYFGVDAVALDRDEQKRNLGVFRYDMATGQKRQIWSSDEGGTWALALSPDGNSMVAAGQAHAFLINDLLGPSPRGRMIPDPPVAPGEFSTALSVAWAPSPVIYVEFSETFVGGRRIARVHPDDLEVEPNFVVAADQGFVSNPLPLSDGHVMFASYTPGPRLMVADAAGAVAALGVTGYCPVAFDPAANVLLYLYGKSLHRRNLTTGADLVIVQSVESASLSR